MTLKPLAWAAATAALALAAPAHAADGGPDIKFSGYGTVAASTLSDDSLGLTRTQTQSKGVGNKLDIGSDSRLGLQAVVNFQSGFSFTAQVEAERRIQSVFGQDKEFDPEVNWLYGQYQFLPSMNVRLGRVALPVYLFSDSVKVTYAQPWLRAPLHIYSTQGFDSIDGVQLNWRDSFGGLNLSAQLTHGQSKSTFRAGGQIVTLEPDVNTAALTAEYGDWLLRLARSEMTAPFPPFAKVADKYTSVGLQYDNGSALLLAEYATRREPSQPAPVNMPLAKGDYGYVGAGWRFGSLLPMLTVSKGHAELLGSPTVSAHAVTFSLRYDVAPNVSLKGQVEQYQANDSTVFITPASDTHKVQSYTVGLDFVF
jgi:predicted porin